MQACNEELKSTHSQQQSINSMAFGNLKRPSNGQIFKNIFRHEERTGFLCSRSEDKFDERSDGFIRTCLSSDGFIRSSLSRVHTDCERDGDESNDSTLPVIQKLSISLSSSREFILEDSRDQEEETDYHDERRTDAMPREPSEAKNLHVGRSHHEIQGHVSLNSLKRANPIYESDNEAEVQVEERSHYIKRRRQSTGYQPTTTTPLYWTEKLAME